MLVNSLVSKSEYFYSAQLKTVDTVLWPHCPDKMFAVTALSGRMTAHVV